MEQSNKKRVGIIVTTVVVIFIAIIGIMYYQGKKNKGTPGYKENIVVRTIDNIMGNKSDTEDLKKKQEEEKKRQKKQSQVKPDENLTKKIVSEKAVLDGKVYLQGEYVCGTMIVKDKTITDAQVKELAQKYAKELKAKYKDKKANVQAVRNGKNIANVTIK